MKNIQHYIEHSKNMEVAGYGRDKKCYRFPADNVALLEYEPIHLKEILSMRLEAIYRLSEKEKSLNNVEAKTLGFVVADGDKVYVLQSLAKGQTIYVPSVEAEMLMLGGKQGQRELAKRNLAKTDILARARQRHYDRFFLDVCEMLKKGIDVDFNRCENFFYDRDAGFTTVDRDINAPIDILKDPQWQAIVQKDIFSVFTNFTAVKGDDRALTPDVLGFIESKKYKDNRIMIGRRVAVAMIRGGMPREKVEGFLMSKETAGFLTLVCRRERESFKENKVMPKLP